MTNALFDSFGIPSISSTLPDILTAEELRGIRTSDGIVSGLYPVQKTGVPTTPILEAAEKFLDSLNPHQRRKVLFPIDSDEWRWWNNTSNNQHRSGLCFYELNNRQRDLAFDLMRAGLSEQGFQTSRDIMRLNETIAEMTGGRYDHYGEYVYWISLFGTPAADRPWGWQMDGHHLILNYFVLGDQVVLSPVFVGSEPIVARSGKYEGTRVFDVEEQNGQALMRTLDKAQRGKAVLSTQLPREAIVGAFRDNYEINYEGLRYEELSKDQQGLLVRLIETYTGYIRPGHAEVRLDEVKRHLGDTYFAWMGHPDDESAAFYYRVHSPVIIIEFDHLPPIAMRDETAREYTFYARPGDNPPVGQKPYRDHVHAMIRTPNGNDYGRDLLRQHYEQFDHAQVAARA